MFTQAFVYPPPLGVGLPASQVSFKGQFLSQPSRPAETIVDVQTNRLKNSEDAAWQSMDSEPLPTEQVGADSSANDVAR